MAENAVQMLTEYKRKEEGSTWKENERKLEKPIQRKEEKMAQRTINYSSWIKAENS